MKNIVTIGGGTGHYNLLRSLKNYHINLKAIVPVTDNGGSSGRITQEFVDFGILPPGDIRNCLLALTDESKLQHMVKLFEHRFPKTNGNLSKHNLGNLILTAAQNIYGKNGIQIIAEMLGIKDSKVLPISPDSTTLCAETESNKILEGQIKVSYPNKKQIIKKLSLKPIPFVYKPAAQALKSAHLIVICPGDLYGSILPNFLVKGVNNILKKSKAKIIYICNLVTKQGTLNFKASDFKKEIEKYLPRKIDYVICNTKKPTKNIIDKYKYENSYFVEPDLEGSNIIKGELLIEQEVGNKSIVRHNSEKTSRIIMGMFNKINGGKGK